MKFQLTHYMVRDKKTGFFSSGGTSPKFNPRGGKVWRQLGHVKNHLRQHVDLTKDAEYARFRAATTEFWNIQRRLMGDERNEAYKDYHENISSPMYARERELKTHWWDYLPDDWEVVAFSYGVDDEKSVGVQEFCKS